MLLNINTNRMFWHSGAGKDSDKTFDRYLKEKKILGKEAEKIDKKFNSMVKKIWEKHLKKQ